MYQFNLPPNAFTMPMRDARHAGKPEENKFNTKQKKSALDALKEAVKEAGMPAFTAKQIADWVYNKRVRSIESMSNISLKNRARTERGD